MSRRIMMTYDTSIYNKKGGAINKSQISMKSLMSMFSIKYIKERRI